MPSLVEALIENGSCVVSSCFSFVYKLNLHFDVVHLQWPEAAFWGGEKISIFFREINECQPFNSTNGTNKALCS